MKIVEGRGCLVVRPNPLAFPVAVLLALGAAYLELGYLATGGGLLDVAVGTLISLVLVWFAWFLDSRYCGRWTFSADGMTRQKPLRGDLDIPRAQIEGVHLEVDSGEGIDYNVVVTAGGRRWIVYRKEGMFTSEHTVYGTAEKVAAALGATPGITRRIG